MEVFGGIASGINIADTGIKLSTSLYTYAETALHADGTVKEIAKDVALTSSVIRQLKALLEQLVEQGSDIATEESLRTADEIVLGCEGIFAEIEAAIERSSTRDEKGEIIVSRLQRLKWPLKQPKVVLLQAKLERFKLLALVILNILLYAQKLAVEERGTSRDDEEYRTIAQLLQKNQEWQAKYENLARKYSDAALDIDSAFVPSRSVRNHTLMLAAIPDARNTEESTKKLASQPLPKHDDRTCLCGQALESASRNSPQASDFHITRTDLTTCIIEIEDFLYLVRRAQSTFRHDSSLGNERCTNVLKEFGKSLSALDKYFPLTSALRHIHRGWDRVSLDTGSVPGGGEDLGETDALSIRPEPSVPAAESAASNTPPTSPNDGKFFHTKPPKIVRTNTRPENINYGRHSNEWLFNNFSIRERVKAAVFRKK